MKKLIKGLHKFQKEVFPLKKNYFEELSKGQKPEVLFITCSDSRINPNLFTSTGPGDLFILRNAGNIIPAYGADASEAATIEFAVAGLGVENIIVCGHSHCGAIEAAIHPEKMEKLPSFSNWVTHNISPTLDLIKKNYPSLDSSSLLNILLQENVLKQVENLKTHPAVSERMQKNKVSIHAWIYKIDDGQIFSFNTQEEQFEIISKN